MVSAQGDSKVRFWKTASYRLVGTSSLLPCNESSDSGLLSATLSKNAKSLLGIVVTQDTGVAIWNESKMIAVWDVLDPTFTHR